MPFAHGWHSPSLEPLSPSRDLIELVVPSSALSCRRVFEGAGLRVAAMVRHWRLRPEARATVFDGLLIDGW